MKNKIMNALVLQKVTNEGKNAIAELDRLCETAVKTSEELLMKIVRDNADTEYGKANHFGEVKNIEDYKRLVPFSTYDDYAGYIARMIDGEENLITTYPIIHYAVSSGSVGVPKKIPVSQDTVKLYSEYSANLMFSLVGDYYRDKFGKKLKKGKGLYAMEAKQKKLKNGVPVGPISATSLGQVKQFLPYLFSSPVEVIFAEGKMDMKYMKIRYAMEEKNLIYMASAFMTALVDLMHYMEVNWEMLLHDIETGTIDASINMDPELRTKMENNLRPNPVRAKELRAIFEQGFEEPIIPRVWPKMEWISAIGTGGFADYTIKMRKYLGEIPIYFSVYGASESLMAVARHMEEGEFVLLPQSGFYEFIPADAEDESVTYTIDQLEVGKDYEIIITNISGFYRYKIKDVIRVTGFHKESPKIKFVYRKNQMISIAGEKTNDEAVAWSIAELKKEVGCEVLDYSIYADTDAEPGRYVVFAETEKPVTNMSHEACRDIIEEKLGIANPSFGKKIQTNVLGRTELHYVQSETYALYRDLQVKRGVSLNQLKPVRVIDNPVKEKFFFSLIDKELE
ncbi:MAG: GH3 auxin-responsive promoter family protein [bacterium]|nr:GH3 auxin-responsive promoter family protein [bacterium]